MFHDPVGIVAVLLLIEGGILLVSEHARTRPIFRFLPSMFWIYSLPMLANTVGLIPAESEVYDAIRKYFLPATLVLLLVSADIVAILKLGKVALGVMLAGSLGVILGGPVVLLAFKPYLPADIWMGFGALSGSWIGGSANMIAVKEAIGTPDRVFLPMVVVDTIVPYAWMGILTAMSAYQGWYDRWNRSDPGIVAHLTRQSQAGSSGPRGAAGEVHPLTLRDIALMFALAAGATLVSLRVAESLPAVKNLVNASAWAIILATGIGIVLSFTPARRLERSGASKLGYAMLYFVLASIGAKTSLSHLLSAPILILAGFAWVFIHALFTIAAARLLKAPMSLAATASQANIGGVASAPAVAGVYQPGLEPVGLLLAVLGNIIGTYLGIVCSRLCWFVSTLR